MLQVKPGRKLMRAAKKVTHNYIGITWLIPQGLWRIAYFIYYLEASTEYFPLK